MYVCIKSIEQYLEHRKYSVNVSLTHMQCWIFQIQFVIYQINMLATVDCWLGNGISIILFDSDSLN